MRYTHTENFVEVLGNGWLSFNRYGMPDKPYPSMAYKYTLRDSDVKRLLESGPITREAIDQWLSTNSGDFSSISDFHANVTIDTIAQDGQTIEQTDLDFPWKNEESDSQYFDMVYGSELE